MNFNVGPGSYNNSLINDKNGKALVSYLPTTISHKMGEVIKLKTPMGLLNSYAWSWRIFVSIGFWSVCFIEGFEKY